MYICLETLDELQDVHKTLQDKVDKLRKQLYSNFQTEIQSLPPIEIIDVFSPIPTPGRPPVAPGTKRTSPAARGQPTIALSPATITPSSTVPALYPRKYPYTYIHSTCNNHTTNQPTCHM